MLSRCVAATTRACTVDASGFQDPLFYATSIGRISGVITDRGLRAQFNEGAQTEGATASFGDPSPIPAEALVDLLDGLAAASYKMTGEERRLLGFLKDHLDYIARNVSTVDTIHRSRGTHDGRAGSVPSPAQAPPRSRC